MSRVLVVLNPSAGGSKPESVREELTTAIRISANPVLSVHVDGEWIGRTPVEIALAPRSVNLVVGSDYLRNDAPAEVSAELAEGGK